MREHNPQQWYLQRKHRLTAFKNTVSRQHWQAQAGYKHHFDAGLCLAKDALLPGDRVFV